MRGIMRDKQIKRVKGKETNREKSGLEKKELNK